MHKEECETTGERLSRELKGGTIARTQPNESRVKTIYGGSPKIELKTLPSHLKYAFLEGKSYLPIIIVSYLIGEMEAQLLKVLQKRKRALGWTRADIKGISISICMHKILMEENFKLTVQPQRRLNLVM